MAVGKEFLNKMTCASPGCSHSNHDGMFLHARCHPQAAAEVEYKEGVLFIRCARCKKPIVDVLVAPSGS